MYRWIKMTLESVGIFVPALVVLIFVLWPFVDRFIGKVTGSKNVATWIGVAGMVFVTCLLVIEAMS
jgi:quinol-cytochrome oxidoreductase complex cytochrome b subunit